MPAGNESFEALLRVADQLSTELGYEEGAEIPGADSPLGGEEGPLVGMLNTDDELLVARVRLGLAKVAAALGDESSDGAPASAIGAALDGAEMVIRGELLRGNAARLPELMPSFVFLVTLPVVDQDRALELSKRAALLIEGALGEGRPPRLR